MCGGGRRNGHGGLVGIRRLVAVIGAREHVVVGVTGAAAGVAQPVRDLCGLLILASVLALDLAEDQERRARG
jgi:hypothetical protein